jgi:hypothetical protein
MWPRPSAGAGSHIDFPERHGQTIPVCLLLIPLHRKTAAHVILASIAHVVN